jgi:hypothetical protein
LDLIYNAADLELGVGTGQYLVDAGLPAPTACRVKMVSAAGIEPATHALKGRCSTN